MKKALFLVLLLMFCFSLYGQNQPNKESVFVQKIVNSECDVSYKIFSEIDNKAYISITDDVNKDLEVRVLTNNVTDALSAVFSFEEALADLKRKRYKDDESSFLYNSFRDSFVKTFIMQPKVLDHLEDCGKENRWVQDSATGKFYFEINKRDELVEYKKESEVESEVESE